MNTPSHSTPPFTWPVRVYWEDTDAGGIVFYANYLKFFERARTEWLRSQGIEQQALKESTGGLFVVSQTQLNYLAPARLDDLLHITARIRQMGRSSIVFEQQALRVSGSGSTLLCEGTLRIGWVDAVRLRPARMPTTLLHLHPL